MIGGMRKPAVSAMEGKRRRKIEFTAGKSCIFGTTISKQDVKNALTVAATLVATREEEQINLVVGYEEDLRSFCITLEMAKGLLQHAEQKQAIGDPGVSVWLKVLRRIADEADAVMDEIAYESLHGKATQKHIRKQVRNFFTPSNSLAVRRRMASKIYDLDAALTKLNNQATGFGLQYILATKRDPERRGLIAQTDALLGDPLGVIGREGDAGEIVRQLIEASNDQPLAVVSIVGVGGLGKTSLAKLVCNHEDIKRHFSKVMWVCVSENFDVLSILVEMLQALSQNSVKDISSQNVVANKIKEELKEKNFLLVLDDVWSEDEQKWENLRNCLMGITQDVRRSRVLVTTRVPKVASIMGSLRGRIDQLSDDDCWSIIKQKAFNNSLVPLELEEIGRKIAQKCRGVPLVANVVGATLRGDRGKEQWLSIEEDFDACGPLDHNDRVLQVLKLSFDRLPISVLKQCFAFCSVFPKDFVMEKEMLVQVWMAHGFIQQTNGSHKELEDVGEQCFMELASYSFFQDIEKDLYGRIVSCKMHDLMHDLAKSLSKSETLVVEDGGTSDIHDIRHLNLMCAPSMGPTRTAKVIQELHSLFSKVDVLGDIAVKFGSLLVLSFCGANVYELPSTLCGLKRLRYLDISETKIEEIPNFISKLYLLQTLRFMKCEFIKRPLEEIENLSNLKHMCSDDEKLLPAGVGSLSCLQTLPLFVLKHQEGYKIEELGQLNKLEGDLKICNLGHVSNKAEADRAKLCEKGGLRSLVLEFDSEGSGDHDDVLVGLMPHSNLKGFALKGYRGKGFPGWMLESTGNVGESTCLKNLMRLEFSNCLCLESIPSLSLSNLMEMHIANCDGLESIDLLSLNKEGTVTIEFCNNLKNVTVSSLKSLTIRYCGELVSVHIGSAAIASLVDVSISGCEKLESLPIIFSELSLLEELSLWRCKELRCIGDGSSSFASTCLTELGLGGCPNLASMPSFKNELLSLQTLSIGHLQQLEILPIATLLNRLSIDGCDGLMHLPNLSGLSSLQVVGIDDCNQLKSIEDGKSSMLPSSLKRLTIRSCSVLTSVSLDGFSSSSSLCLEEMYIHHCDALAYVKPPCVKHLRIQNCHALTLLSLDGVSSSSSTCLEKLNVSLCSGLTTFPNLNRLTSLQKLSIWECSGLRRLPDGLESLLHLSCLELGGFSQELEEFPDLSLIQHLNSCSLEELLLIGWDKLKHLPHQIQHLTALRVLRISYFKGLEALPDWLDNLSSLQKLNISICSSLMYKPFIEAIQRLSNLEHLEIIRCPELEERYRRDCGTKRDKLSHIPNIRLNRTQVRGGTAPPMKERKTRTGKSSFFCWRGQETNFKGCL